MVGILVIGNNHFILSGPEPDKSAALELARHWSIIQIGGDASLSYKEWMIRTKEYRENLEWAVVMARDGEISAGVTKLLGELEARGVEIRNYGGG